MLISSIPAQSVFRAQPYFIRAFFKSLPPVKTFSFHSTVAVRSNFYFLFVEYRKSHFVFM
ncbi:hypothetical protein BACCAP_00930 [Pseudoflavonifractor capillosus ATCC 29799]|uniref:Uncharacterized protein n=1 Tax=Pseudoflavonifractor capillosus ATCC 29799 TaxID=411467 RepID=A6NRV3_9FIRM|nr:hypothetical protein BACCAP_00930 [Pseudoflavonifractor capillosus ATCC 29799]